MIDEHGRAEHLSVRATHRADCTFGSGFYRLCFGSQVRFAQTQDEVERARRLLAGVVREIRIERDGYCLDGDMVGDANTPDVVDGEWWLGLNIADGMRELGLGSERDYTRAYRAIEAAVYRRDNRESQGGVHASVIVKRAGRRVKDV